MIGLMVLGFWVLYFSISVGLAYFVAYRSQRFGTAKGIGVFIMMWAVVIQDYPLMEWEYRRLCRTEGGFRQYKTAEQWQQENPGVWETLEPVERETVREGENFYHMMNQRFRYGNEIKPVHLGIEKGIEFIQDIKTGEVMAETYDFYSGFTGRDQTMAFLFFWRNHGRCFPPPKYNVKDPNYPSRKLDTIYLLFKNGNQGEQQ